MLMTTQNLSNHQNVAALATPSISGAALPQASSLSSGATRWPHMFRVVSIERMPIDGHSHRTTARLFHENAAISVYWTSGTVDARITRGSLVAIRWLRHLVATDDVVRISRLVLMEKPEPSINLFHTIPTTWVNNRDLVERAADQFEKLPRGFQHLFNAIFWDGKRLHRYLTGPGSLNGHHNVRSGNFRHSVEVAERALSMADDCERTFAPVLILGALLHDAGKADEYRFNSMRQVYEMSERGTLVGHKHTILEWISAAMACHRIILPETHYLGLVHALTAAKGAPDWLGIRPPMSMDATILSMADRLSGESDLHAQLAPGGTGFGKYHRHLGGRPYVVG